MKQKNINIITFNHWALKDKDIAMQKGHEKSVKKMMEIINNKTNIMNRPFAFVDLGCGNGWVCREISKNNYCELVVGVDGSQHMIEKAKKFETRKNIYIQTDIESWKPNYKFDIVFSMETFYYFTNPSKIIKIFHDSLNDKGIIIIGIDHYLENKQSLNWEKEYNLSTTTLSINKWKSIFKSCGFNNVEIDNFGKTDKWEGTLIIFAQK